MYQEQTFGTLSVCTYHLYVQYLYSGPLFIQPSIIQLLGLDNDCFVILLIIL